MRTDSAGAESPDYQEGSEWKGVDLPHTWNIEDTFDDEPGYYRGIGWYRKEFAVPESWKGKRIVIRFEAACSVATVWVNGQLLGQHKGAWTPFEFDITELVEPGGRRNVVAVRVDNRWRRDVPPHDMDFNIMGGLHREVFSIATDPVHIVSTRVTTPEVSETTGVAALEIEIRNETKRPWKCEIATEIQGPGLAEPITLASHVDELPPGQSVLVKQQTRPIANPKLWSPDEPNLYRVSFRLLVDGRLADDAESPLGFRWYRFDRGQRFLSQRQALEVARREPARRLSGFGLGVAEVAPNRRHQTDQGDGRNFLRTVHYPQHPVVLETCDKLGLLVWEEVPFDGEGPQKASIAGADDLRGR